MVQQLILGLICFTRHVHVTICANSLAGSSVQTSDNLIAKMAYYTPSAVVIKRASRGEAEMKQ